MGLYGPYHGRLGFGYKKRRQIKASLMNASVSIMFNGSPIDKFKKCRVSNNVILFILVIHGLHAVVCRSLYIGISRGASVEHHGFIMSHFCEDTTEMTEILCCGVSTFPFSYIDIPVRCNMSCIFSWNAVIDKFKKKFSVWKTKSLSVGGRLTLIKVALGNVAPYLLSIFIYIVRCC